jgi:hypothetical protein
VTRLALLALICGWNAWPALFGAPVPPPATRWPPPRPAQIGMPPSLPADCHRVIGGPHRGEVIRCDCLPVGAPAS